MSPVQCLQQEKYLPIPGKTLTQMSVAAVRNKINKLLEAAGRRFFPSPNQFVA